MARSGRLRVVALALVAVQLLSIVAAAHAAGETKRETKHRQGGEDSAASDIAALRAELANLKEQVQRQGHMLDERGTGARRGPEQAEGGASPRVVGAAAMSMTHLRETSPEAAAAAERHGAAIEHHYIVGLRGHATEEHVERVKAHARAAARAKHGAEEGHVEVTRSFSHALRGFSARLTPEVRAELAAHEDVSFVVPDRVLLPAQSGAQSTSELFFPAGTGTPLPDFSTGTRIEPSPWAANLSAWHLDRLDGSKPLDGKYQRGTVDGANVDIYVLDTGIFANHPEFGSRVLNAPPPPPRPPPPTPTTPTPTTPSLPASTPLPPPCRTTDLRFHGTAVASVAAGSTLGAAPGATILALKVFAHQDRSNPTSNCFAMTSSSSVIAGMDAAIASMNSRTGRKAVVLLGVVSASLSVGNLLTYDPAYNDAVTRLRNVGAVVVTAAGNDASDSCTALPGNTPNVINVGASDQDDYRAGFSNWGSCVTLFAPGQNILAAMKPYEIDTGSFETGSKAYFVITDHSIYPEGFTADRTVVHGTSFSAALAAGVIALYRQAFPSATVATVESAVKTGALSGALVATSLRTGSPDLLLSVKNLVLPGFASTVGSPAYNASLVQATVSGCSSLRETLANKPKDLYRVLTRWYRVVGDWSVEAAAAGVPYLYSTPQQITGVFVARLRVEQDRINFRISVGNYSEFSRPEMYLYIGSPSMPSYQRISSSESASSGLQRVYIHSPFTLKSGTYYVLVQGWRYSAADYRAFSREFRLDTTDDSCATPPGAELTTGSGQSCSALELTPCGQAVIISTPQNNLAVAIGKSLESVYKDVIPQSYDYDGNNYYFVHYRSVVSRVILPTITSSGGSARVFIVHVALELI
eukprot:tig00021037_g17479.t1